MLISSLSGANPLPPEHKIGIFVRFAGATAGSNGSNGSYGNNVSNGNNRSNRNDGRDSLGC